MKCKLLLYGYAALLASIPLLSASTPARAQAQKPNIILIVSDDFGYGDSGPYGGVKIAACRPPVSTVWRLMV